MRKKLNRPSRENLVTLSGLKGPGKATTVAENNEWREKQKTPNVRGLGNSVSVLKRGWGRKENPK